MISATKLSQLRNAITENLRVQLAGQPIDYIDAGTAVQDACAKQNHAIFARRGCGKTLLLHHAATTLDASTKAVYLNCEDFKRHSFPNVLIEVLRGLFREMDRNFSGWFGRKKKSKRIIQEIISKLDALQRSADKHDEDIKKRSTTEDSDKSAIDVGVDIDKAKIKASSESERKERTEIERSFKIHREKLQELDRWLPELKVSIRDFFELSSTTKCIILQIDDFYHLRRIDQAFVMDYIHRLCKDVPLYFKVASLRHASTLFADRDGQPIGAQERHDYQPINIDYTFNDFKKTADLNWKIILKFGERVGLKSHEMDSLFKGEGFARLVMAGGGVPRDVLSLFLQILSDVDAGAGGRIGKDEVRILSRTNFERKIEELKQDSQGNEQDELLRGIYIIRQFCLEKKTNVFVVQERMLQQNDALRALFYRLLDYRIIHSCATALTHKSQQGTYQAFAIDIGCYAHLRKLHTRFVEVDVSDNGAKEKMRSSATLDEKSIETLFSSLPAGIESALLSEDA